MLFCLCHYLVVKVCNVNIINPDIPINELSMASFPSKINRDLATLAALLLSFYEYKDGKIGRLLDKQFKLNDIIIPFEFGVKDANNEVKILNNSNFNFENSKLKI